MSNPFKKKCTKSSDVISYLVIYDITKSDAKFRLYENRYLLEPMYCALGNYYKEEDLPVIIAGEAAGKKYIYDKAYGLSVENTL